MFDNNMKAKKQSKKDDVTATTSEAKILRDVTLTLLHKVKHPKKVVRRYLA
jgi:hypothetical protein